MAELVQQNNEKGGVPNRFSGAVGPIAILDGTKVTARGDGNEGFEGMEQATNGTCSRQTAERYGRLCRFRRKDVSPVRLPKSLDH